MKLHQTNECVREFIITVVGAQQQHKGMFFLNMEWGGGQIFPTVSWGGGGRFFSHVFSRGGGALFFTYRFCRTTTTPRRINNERSLRCSNHKLAIETGRYSGIYRNLRYCDLCALDILGDAYHTFFECTKPEIVSFA